MPHAEERDFVFHLKLRAEFPDDYEGDADGYAWAQDIPALTAEMLRALVAVVARHPSWTVRPTNRGRSSEEEVSLIVERKF
jgi:hypothetical protein